MSTGLFSLVIILTVILLVVLRWSHRCWGNAILATLFAPLIGVPIAAVTFMAIALILRLLNGFLSGFGVGLSMSTLNIVGTTITILFVLFLGILYCKEQRHLSLVQTGPRFGPSFEAPKPDVYRMPGPKI